MENKDRFLFHEDRIRLTVFNIYGFERASWWYTWIQYPGKGKYICLPCRRSWHLHWAALSICSSLFPQQSLLEWGMLISTQNTAAHSAKADSVDQSSAVVEHPLPQTCSQVTVHLPEAAACTLAELLIWDPAAKTPASKTHSHGATTVETRKKLDMKWSVTGKALFVQREQTHFVQIAL